MASPSVGVKLVGFGWSFFIIENVILSHNRTLVINEIGDDKYHLLYNSLSLASCLSISIGLLKGTRSPSLFKKNLLLKTMAFGLRGTGFVLISQQIPALGMPSDENKSKCPLDFNKSNCLERITRHPMLMSMALIGMSFGVLSGSVGFIGLGLGPTVMAFVGGAHQDWRRGIGGTLDRVRDSKTSLVPFQALVEGRQKWSDLYNDLKPINAVVGLIFALTAFL